MTIRYYPPGYPSTQSDPIPRQAQVGYEDYKKIRGFEDVGHFLIAYVVSGGVVTPNVWRNDKVDASDVVVSLNDDIMARDGTSFRTEVPNTTYYLDFDKDGDWHWGTSHADGSASTDYLPVAEVNTDGNGLVDTIADVRGVVGGFRLKSDYGLTEYLRPIYNVIDYGVEGDGVTDDTSALQELIDIAVSEGRKAIFFPYGQYFVTSLTNADQFYFFGDNASFVGGYSGTIYQIGKGYDETEQEVEDARGGFGSLDARLDQMQAESDIINGSRIQDNTLPSSKLRITTDADRIKLENLSDEVLQAMAGTTPVNSIPADLSVTTGKIAPDAVTHDKMGMPYLRGSVSSGTVIVTTVTKSIAFNSAIINYQGVFNDIGTITVNYSGENFRVQYVFYNVSTGTVEVYETFTVPENAELILLFSFYNGKVSDSLNLSNITIDGSPSGGWEFYSGQGVGTLFAPTINIDTVNHQLVLGEGPKGVVHQNSSYGLGSEEIIFDLGDPVSGFLYFDTANSTFNKYTFTADLPNVKVTEILLGVFLTTRFNLNCTGFTVNGELYLPGGPTMTPLMRWAGKKVNCLGDSITQGNTTYATEPYHFWFTKICGFSVVRNYGLSGSRVQISPGQDHSFLERYPLMDNDADVITVLGGVNDWWSSLPLGTFTDRVDNTFYGALHLLYIGLIAKYPDKTIVAMTPLKFYREGVPEVNDLGNTLEQFVEAVREVANHYSIPLYDLNKRSGLSGEPEHIALYWPDGVHPTSAGHKRIATGMANYINNV